MLFLRKFYIESNRIKLRFTLSRNHDLLSHVYSEKNISSIHVILTQILFLFQYNLSVDQ